MKDNYTRHGMICPSLAYVRYLAVSGAAMVKVWVDCRFSPLGMSNRIGFFIDCKLLPV